MNKAITISLILVVNIIGWYIYSSNQTELQDLKDQNEILQSELQNRPKNFRNKNFNNISNSFEPTKKEVTSNNERFRQPASISKESNIRPEEFSQKELELLDEARKVLPPHIVEQFKSAEGRENMYKNLLEKPELKQELEKLDQFNPTISRKFYGLFNEKEIVENAKRDIELEMGDGNTSGISTDNLDTLTGSDTSENSSEDLDNE